MQLNSLATRFIEAWNSRDAASMAACFARSGTYRDPTLEMSIHPFDLRAVVATLDAWLPDFRFEILSVISGDDRTVLEWRLTGTNTKPIKPGIEPTGRTLRISGVDVMVGSDGGFTEVTRHFDQKLMFEQIGMQVIIEPLRQGKATYGYSKRVTSGNPGVPAVIALTWIGYRDQSELDRIRMHSAKIINSFLEEPGFISIVTGAAGDRAFTVTAWESEQALYSALSKDHAFAKQDFRTSDVAPGVWTSVWKPDHINRLWARCPSCNTPNDVTHVEVACANCGAKLGERPLYW